MGRKKKEITIVQSMEMVEHHRVVNLRRFIDVHLAQERMTNTVAAKRAGVSLQRWSHLKSAESLTPNEFATLAKGIGMKPEALLNELEGEAA